MRRYVYDDETEVVGTSNGSNVASNIIWALTTLVIVGAIIWAVFYSPLFRTATNPIHKIAVDANVSVPANR